MSIEAPKFTPPPWFKAGEQLSDEFMDRFIEMEIIELTNGQTLIAEVQKLNNEISAEEVEANAHLIAAAPELYEALEHINEYWNRDHNTSAMSDALWHIIEVAQAALAKARGEG